jgi:hypothetical protein
MLNILGFVKTMILVWLVYHAKISTLNYKKLT